MGIGRESLNATVNDLVAEISRSRSIKEDIVAKFLAQAIMSDEVLPDIFVYVSDKIMKYEQRTNSNN